MVSEAGAGRHRPVPRHRDPQGRFRRPPAVEAIAGKSEPPFRLDAECSRQRSPSKKAPPETRNGNCKQKRFCRRGRTSIPSPWRCTARRMRAEWRFPAGDRWPSAC
jgi:hypothetical protein